MKEWMHREMSYYAKDYTVGWYRVRISMLGHVPLAAYVALCFSRECYNLHKETSTVRFL